MPMELENCYRILGIRSDADFSEVKSAFRRLALQYHPDRNKGFEAEAKFNAITEAYSTIMISQGYQVRPRAIELKDVPVEQPGGKLPFTVFADREIVHNVSPRVYESEVRKHFSPSLAPGTSCKIGGRWFEIDVVAQDSIPLISKHLGKRKVLIEWYKTPEGVDKWKTIPWDDFWAYVRRFASLAST